MGVSVTFCRRYLDALVCYDRRCTLKCSLNNVHLCWAPVGTFYVTPDEQHENRWDELGEHARKSQV